MKMTEANGWKKIQSIIKTRLILYAARCSLLVHDSRIDVDC